MTGALRPIFFVLLIFACYNSSYADDVNYATSAIPVALLKNANAVIRNAHLQIRIVSAHEIHVIHKYAVTVLNEKGAKYGIITQLKNKIADINYIEGSLYDKDGNEIQKLKKKDIKINNPYGQDMIDDIHYKTYDFGYGSFPYTCEYEIEIILNSSFDLPDWQPQNNFDCSVASSDLEVEYPLDFLLHYRIFHMETKPSMELADDVNKFTCSVSNLAARKRPDDFAPTDNYYLPAIIMSADKFELLDEKGSMATWQDLGKFVYKLNVNRDELPDAVKKIVHQLTDTCSNSLGKINLLYGYLKKNTRYVSIQLGIGGWQTFDAKFVSEKGYGDCKALSNYMKALLKEAGITSFQAWVYGGQENEHQMITDFPNNAFNHSILCIPLMADTIWVECTSKSLPAGYLSSFTDNRYALLLTPDGGFPVRTPVNKIEDNLLTRRAEIQVNEKDEMTGDIDLTYRGNFWENEHGLVINEPKSDVDNYLNSKFKLGSYSISNYKISNDLSGSIPSVYETIAIKGEGNISRNTQHMFLSPGIFNFHIAAPSSYELRKEPFQIHRSYQVTDTITYRLTGNYIMDEYKGGNFELPFAAYHYQVILENNNTLKIAIFYSQKDGIYPPEQFADYIRLYKQINTDFNNKFVFRKKD